MIIDVTWFGSHVTKKVIIINMATDDALFWSINGIKVRFADQILGLQDRVTTRNLRDTLFEVCPTLQQQLATTACNNNFT